MDDANHKIKVLIVDDDAMLGAILSTGLQIMGIESVFQTSLAGLQSVVEVSHPNIILLDVEVGDTNSIDLMQQLKLYAEGIPVVFMSSHVDAGYQTKAITDGAIAFLKKPVDVEEVAAYVKRFAKTKEQQQDAASTIKIASYAFDIHSRELFRKGKKVCRITSKQSIVLKRLMEHPNETVSRQDLKQALWPDGNESDASLENYISQLRKIFSEDRSMCIMTVPKTGFLLHVF